MPARHLWGLLALCAALPVVKAGLLWAGGFELHFDEAQYWEWSRRLDWSYYSKGPLAAWLIALSTGLFGHGEWQVRLPAWLAYDAFLVVLFLFTRDLTASLRSAWWAVALGLVMPVYFLLGSVMTTDVLVLLAWTVGLWAAWRAVARGERRAWYGLGVAVGLGGLSKLSIGLLPFFLGLYLLASRDGRRQLASPHPWLGGVLAVALLAPVWGWNAANDWVMFRHEQRHVVGSPADLGRPLEFLAGQLAALSPVLAVALVVVLWRPPTEPGRRLLWWVSVSAFAFFLAKATYSKVQMNWPAPTYVGLMVLFAERLPDLVRRRPRPLAAGFALAVFLLPLAFFPGVVGLKGSKDPFYKMKGWREPMAALAAEAGHTDFILSDNYTVATEIAFYWPGHPTVYLTGRPKRRYSQYDLWPAVDREAGRDGVVVTTGDQPEFLDQAFAGCRALTPQPSRTPDGSQVRTLKGWACRGYRPIQWPEPGFH